MPGGIPVATVAVDGAKNAGILAAKILSVDRPELMDKLSSFMENQRLEVMKKADDPLN